MALTFSPELIKSFISKKLKKESLLLFSSFLIFIFFVSLGTRTSIFYSQIKPEQIIKEIAVKHQESIDGQPVKWIKALTSGQIDGNKKYLELSKGANDITIKKGESAKEAFLNLGQEISSNEAIKIPQKTRESPALFARSLLLRKIWDYFSINIEIARANLIMAQKPVIIETGNNKFLDLKSLENLPSQDLITVEYYVEE